MYRNASLPSVGAAPRLLVPRVCAPRSTDPLSRGNRRGPASPQAFPDARCRTHDASPLGNPRASRIRWGYRPWLGAPACVFLVEILRQGRLHQLRQHTNVRVMIETVDDLHAGDFEPGDLVARTGVSRIGPPTPFPRRWCFRGSDRAERRFAPRQHREAFCNTWRATGRPTLMAASLCTEKGPFRPTLIGSRKERAAVTPGARFGRARSVANLYKFAWKSL